MGHIKPGGLNRQSWPRWQTQGTACLAKGQVTQLIQDDQIGVHEPIGQLSRFIRLFLPFQLTYQLNGREAADPLSVMLNGAISNAIRSVVTNAAPIY